MSVTSTRLFTCNCMKIFSYLILIIGFSLACSFPLVAQQYQVQQLSAKPFAKTFSRVGKVSFKRTQHLSFKSQGFLKHLYTDEGQYFKKGDLLASLEATDLRAVKDSHYVQLMQAKREVNRIKELMRQNLSSQQALDLAETQVQTARHAYQVAYYNLEKSEIKAPFDGVVLSRFVDMNASLMPSVDVLEVAAIDNNLMVKVALTTDEISYVRLNQVVQVQVTGAGNFNGSVTKVPVKANAAGNMYIIEVTLQGVKVGDTLVSDQFANVTLSFETDQSVLKVPNSALVQMNDSGQAGFYIESSEMNVEKAFFDITHIDSQFLYIDASGIANELAVITNGWQQFELGEF